MIYLEVLESIVILIKEYREFKTRVAPAGQAGDGDQDFTVKQWFGSADDVE